MLGVRKNFNRRFARISPVFAALGIMVAAVCGNPSATDAKVADKTTNTAVKREAAGAQFARAEEQRANLNGKPAEKRALAEYKTVVASYRRVYLITPRAAEVADSLLSVAELYTEMGDRFGRSYYQSAVDSYQFLVHEYPTSKYCQDATLRMAKLQRDQLGDSALSKKTYEDFLKRYPRSPRKREAQEALAELALLQNGDAPTATNSVASNSNAPAVTAEEPRANPPVHSGGKSVSRSASGEIPRVRRIRAAANGDATRVTIDLEDSVVYTSGRIANPDRIFFDLHSARLTPEVARGNIRVDGGLLTAVRVAQNHNGVVRVVLDVNGVKDYAASLTNNPPQLLIDLYGNSPAAAPVRTAKGKKLQLAVEGDSNESATPANGEARTVQNAAAKNSAQDAAIAPEQPMANSKSAISSTIKGDATSAGAIGGVGAGSNSSAVARNSLPGAKNTKSKSVKATAAGAKPDLIRPASAPQPTRDGQSTLTRALGLKIGRIVIDAGHGGHDTGTIGPTGLMEKDLCLDVALRLGKIIEQRLPGADVVYTRSDDSFIPLEQRTEIANDARADLFLSVHANSSPDRKARGIETYYLNFTGSSDAMEVATRENALSENAVHDLQDIVNKIARNEKIEESRDLAGTIQDSLANRVGNINRGDRSRGVRKAPFVVLIGANMPSVLAEISFISNPSDEQWLKKPESRQRVAEGLYRGIEIYLQNTNSLTPNQIHPAPGNRTGIVARSGNPQ